jgi:ABC-type lipoprotein release transport system permease subunit
MASYMQGYGVAEARRNRIIKFIVLGVVSVGILSLVTYLIVHDYSEKQLVKKFLAEVNAHDYQKAYATWNCERSKTCENYSYGRFMDDWGPTKKVSSPWRIVNDDSCKTFLTVNVAAQGSELQSLAVERGENSIGFAPAPECQEAKWHWKQFFQRILRRSS